MHYACTSWPKRIPGRYRGVQFKERHKQEFLQAPVSAFCSKYLDCEDMFKALEDCLRKLPSTAKVLVQSCNIFLFFILTVRHRSHLCAYKWLIRQLVCGCCLSHWRRHDSTQGLGRELGGQPSYAHSVSKETELLGWVRKGRLRRV